MSSADSASVQFDPVSVKPYGQTQPPDNDAESLVSLSARNSSSADAATAWRVRRGSKPLPYSKRTMGSLYDFNQE